MLTKDKLIKFDLEKKYLEKLSGKQTIELMVVLNKVHYANEFLVTLPSYPRTADKIYREELLLAVGGTQRIEGTNLTEEELEEAFSKEEHGYSLLRAEQEAINSKKVYEFIIEYVNNNKDQPITEALIKQIHTIITKNIDYLSNKPGEYRNSITTFGIPRKPAILKTESEIKKAMLNFTNWLNDESQGNFLDNPLVKANLAHYYLTEIHPFFDGNGRTARALEAMILYKSGGFNSFCFWSLANYFSVNRDKYLYHLRQVRNTLKIISFLTFAANGYLEELNRIKNRAVLKVKKLMYMDYIHFLLRAKKTQEIKINQRILFLLELLCEKGKIPISKFYNEPSVKGIYSKISNTTIFRDFKKMTSSSLIKTSKIPDKKKGDVYIECNYGILEGLNYG